VACMWEERKVYRVLIEKPEGKRPLVRPRRRWEGGIRMDIGEIGWVCVWSGLSWLRIRPGGGLLWMRWWTFGFWRHGVNYVNSYELNVCPTNGF
jgi:hypothetical protein